MYWIELHLLSKEYKIEKMKIERVLFPILFIVVICFVGMLVSRYLLRSLAVQMPPMAIGLMWSGVIVCVISFSSLVITSVYHLGTVGYIVTGILFLCLSVISGIFVTFRYRIRREE